MSSPEFSEWAAFYTLEPWGYEMENWRVALIAAMVANTVRNPKKKRKAYQPEDFMPKEDAEPERPSQETLRAKMDMAMTAMGGRLKP